MNLNNNPSSENPENQDSMGKNNIPDGQKEAFDNIAKAENNRNLGSQEVIKNTQDQLKKERSETPEKNNIQDALKQNPSTSPKNHPHFHDKKEDLQSSGMTLAYENSVKGCIIGVGGTCMSIINTSIDIGKGVLTAPKDLYDLVTGNATYDGFENA